MRCLSTGRGWVEPSSALSWRRAGSATGVQLGDSAKQFSRAISIPVPRNAVRRRRREAIATGSAVVAVSRYYDQEREELQCDVRDVLSGLSRATSVFGVARAASGDEQHFGRCETPAYRLADVQVVIHSVDRDVRPATRRTSDLRGSVASDPRTSRVAPRQSVPAFDLIDVRKASGS